MADKWQTTFDVITDPIMILDANFQIQRANKAATDFFRLSEGEIIGKTCFNLMHGTQKPPDGCPFFNEMVETKEHKEAEIFLENKGLWVSASVDPILDDQGRIIEVVHIVKDITDRKNKEDLLRKNQEKYRTIFNDSPICLTEIDCTAIKNRLVELIQSGVTDLRKYFTDHPEEVLQCLYMVWIKDCNKAVLDLYGMKNKQEYFEFLRGQIPNVKLDDSTFHDFVNAWPSIASLEEFKETLITLGTGKTVFESEIAIPVEKGEEKKFFDVRWSVPERHEHEFDRALVSMIDITKLKKAEAALRESEDKYRSVVEKSLAGFFIIQDEYFRFVNQRFCKITGYSYEEIVDKLRPVDLVHPDDSLNLKERMHKKLSGEVIYNDDELRTVRKDGQTIITKILVDTMTYNGKPALIGTIIDVTKERNLEFQLNQAHKMEAIGTLAGGIAHDFNNLLMTILGYTSLLQMEPDMDNSILNNLKIIEEQVQKGADLTRQLLGFARSGKYEVIPTNINELLAKTAEMFGRTKKEIRIFKTQQERIWTVEVDRGQMEQVFLNLLVNAWQAMPAGGDLYLQTQNIVIDESHSSSVYIKPGRYVKASVTDQGAGMDELTKQRIFEPFFTTREMGRGTGLGLASVYGIIKNHGGIINVYSEKGQGTTFNIYLPVSEKEIVKEKAVARQISRGSETVLLIDDQEPVIQVGESMLSAIGYNVLTAGYGEDAIALYKKKQKKIDLVILDMIMPGMGGSEVFDQLKEINPAVKVILSSGYSLNDQATKILSRGCNGFIQKPFGLADLSRKIREVLDEDLPTE